MERILTAKQMQEADRRTIEEGIPSLVLMERAAMAVVRAMQEAGTDLSGALVLAGTGNNGGDGLAIARILYDLGFRPCVLAIGEASRYSEERKQQEQMLPSGIPILSSWQDADLHRMTVLIDALFGIGLSRPVDGVFKETIEAAAESGIPAVAVDIPSGIHSDTGEILGCALPAVLTVTFSACKPGLLRHPGKAYCGLCKTVPIGIRLPQADAKSFLRVTEEDLQALPPRDEGGNKGTFGKVLVIAGSWKICGAAYLSAMAALRSGIGMVRIYTEESNRIPLASSFPEALLETYTEGHWEPDGLQDAIDWADTILIGPGIGTGSTAEQILSYVLEHAARPLVLDADACNLLANDPAVLSAYEGVCYLTPHLLEMSRLTRLSVEEIRAQAPETALSFAEQWNATVVLKDATTLIAEPGGTVYFYDGGCSALSTAGSGDVLAGMLAGLIARMRGMDLPVAALAVCMHGTCGNRAAEGSSSSAVIAGDLFPYFSELF